MRTKLLALRTPSDMSEAAIFEALRMLQEVGESGLAATLRVADEDEDDALRLILEIKRAPMTTPMHVYAKSIGVAIGFGFPAGAWELRCGNTIVEGR